MSAHDDLLNQLNQLMNIEYLGNSVFAYLLALVILIVLIIALYILKLLVLRKVESSLKKTERLSKINIIVSGLDRALNFPLIFFFSLYFSIRSLDVDPLVTLIVKILLLVNVTYFLLKFSFVLVDYLISFHSQRTDSSTNILEFMRLMLKTALTIIFTLWILSNLEVDTTVFIASLGVFALAIAFALQNVIADIFAALTIYLDKPFEIGDTIVVGGEMGQVERIGIRSTRLRTLQGHMLIVSNRELINSRISNYQRMERRRIPVVLGVHYSTSTAKLREIPNMVKEIIEPIESVTFDRMFMTNLAGSAIEFELVFFVQSKSYSTYLRIQEEVLMKILDKFSEEDISIPYPTQTILLEKTKSNGEMI